MLSHWTGVDFVGGPLLLAKRFGFRWLFVAATGGVAMCLPFVPDLMGLVGEQSLSLQCAAGACAIQRSDTNDTCTCCPFCRCRGLCAPVLCPALCDVAQDASGQPVGAAGGDALRRDCHIVLGGCAGLDWLGAVAHRQRKQLHIFLLIYTSRICSTNPFLTAIGSKRTLNNCQNIHSTKMSILYGTRDRVQGHLRQDTFATARQGVS